MQLNSSHIEFIRSDLQRRGIVSAELLDEMTDHFCSAVEVNLDRGMRFFEAYQNALKEFGNIPVIQEEDFKIQQQPNQMIRNYIIIAWRNIKKQRFYSFINIFGLATGIAATLMIALFVLDEISYDNFHDKRDRIYRINS